MQQVSYGDRDTFQNLRIPSRLIATIAYNLLRNLHKTFNSKRELEIITGSMPVAAPCQCSFYSAVRELLTPFTITVLNQVKDE